ncbi:MAG: sulfurtransferase [Planctomycetes bacterium]|nr:sulfurtransferase [Planctomycetota bacterium]
MDPRALSERLLRGDALVLLDVRESDEVALCSIRGSRSIPMGSVPARRNELDPTAEVVCICHHGVRSARVAGWLVAQGFTRVLNLTGGIDRWAEDVDPTMTRY